MDLSVVLPARNEMFLARTIQSILESSEAKTEVIALLDGQWADPGIPQHDLVNVIYVPVSVGQRAGTNMAVRLARGKYVMKVDAHCSFDQGFDRKMIEGFEKNPDATIMVPIMRNLHAFDWKCYKCGSRWYQGPTPTRCMLSDAKTPNENCVGPIDIRRKMVWEPRRGSKSTSYRFDSEPHFQYFQEYRQREPYLTDKKTGFTETMSLQGSCFMSTRDDFWELDLSDESFGNWGNQGLELACRAWLSGGRVLVNHNTWYAHMFRTQGGDFGFPYPQSGRDVQQTKNKVKDFFWGQKWDKQIHPVSWLVDKFWPVPGWSDEDLAKLKESELTVK